MKNHYETLGLPFGASAEQIRKRYRELVRRYHPDVNPSPEAKEQFLRIQEAYQVLSDPERRRHYDALLRMRLQAGGSGSRGHAAAPKSPSASTAHPTESMVKLDEARRAILQAEQAFLQGRLRDALYWARQATRLQPRVPKGYEIMGDVYRVQGHDDAALNAYTYALQPRSPTEVRASRPAHSDPPCPCRSCQCAPYAETAYGMASVRGAVSWLGCRAVPAGHGVGRAWQTVGGAE
ncbi:MAG: hypothetical protein C4336_03710 [Armatimonadota bacterium]